MSPYILVVDDDADLCRQAASALEAAGYVVKTVADGAAALSLIERDGPPTLVVSDLAMPVMGGAELRVALHQDHILRDIPVILCSAVQDLGGYARVMRCAGHLPKPLEPERLLALVSKLTPLPTV